MSHDPRGLPSHDEQAGPIVIAVFNNKGGVSKTTTTMHLGWMLAEKGYRTVVVDADPQCNLTGVVLGYDDEAIGAVLAERDAPVNVYAALRPAFESQPRAMTPVDCIAVTGRDGLYLAPGHVALAEHEVQLSISQQLSESLQALKNLPGSLRHLLDITAGRYDAKYVLVDMSPGLGAMNQNLLSTSDAFIVPINPDVFSLMAIDSLARILPRWLAWSERAAKMPALANADYPFRPTQPKFLGTVVQKYRLRKGKPTQGFQQYVDRLASRVREELAPALAEAGALYSPAKYETAGIDDSYAIASVSDFNTLIADAQQARKPVFAITQDDVSSVGIVWDGRKAQVDAFRKVFEELADRVVTLTA